MDLITLNSNLSLISSTNSNHPVNNKGKLFLGFCNYPLQFYYLRNKSSSSIAITYAKKKKKNSPPEFSAFQPTIIEEVIQSDDDDEDFEELGDDELLITDDFDDEEFVDDEEDYFDDEYATENAEVYAGDGAEGGGISLAGTWWDKEALALAEKVTKSFDGDLGIYAFRTLANARIQVRIEKISTKSGSPSISDIEAFSTAYRTQLDEAEVAKTIPENIYLEVSSPGVERVIRIPEELDRFTERNIYVKYLDETAGSASENDGVFRLVSLDLETKCCTWGLADVRINREKAGKGRPMSKKQRELRVTTPFDSIRLARLYSEV